MTLKIESYTIETKNEISSYPITYWGIYLDDREISMTSTKEQAEHTKKWMEDWLSNSN